MNGVYKIKQKIQDLKIAVKDNRFMNDLREVSEDFTTVDSEGWPDEDGKRNRQNRGF